MVKKRGLTLKTRTITKVGFGATIFLGAFALAFLTSADFAPISDSFAADINVSNTATGYFANLSTSGAIDLEITASPSGAAKIGKDTLTVETNAKNGYKLYISTISGATGTSLYNEDADSEIPASSGTVSDPISLATNTWGYVPSRATSTATAVEYEDADVDPDSGTAELIGVPAYGSENVLYTNTTPTDATTNTLDVYYGVNADTSLPSGEYSNTIVYTAVVDAVNSDSKDASIAPSSQSGLNAGTSVTISTGLYPGFSADDLGEITVKVGDNDCASITPSITAAGNLNISCLTPAQSATGKYTVTISIPKYNKTYALTDGYEYLQVDYMQDFSVSAHSSDATGTTYTLADSRDGQTYTAAKLADGNIWMTQNLKLQNYTLKPEDSNVTSNWTLPASSTSYWCTTSNSTNCDGRANVLDSGNASYGVYYNWYAATAGQGTYSKSSGDVSTSICPKGWKLPTSSQFQTLYNNYNSASNMMSASGPAFVLSGYRYGSSTVTQGSGGYYWSSTAYSANYAYSLYLDSSSVSPQNVNFKYIGLPVRCVASS